jgi:hypothetical protein
LEVISGTPTQTNDYCGVRLSSGVLTTGSIFYVGKSGTNDIGSSYNVTGITIDKAAKIARLESVYLSANSTFKMQELYGIQSTNRSGQILK